MRWWRGSLTAQAIQWRAPADAAIAASRSAAFASPSAAAFSSHLIAAMRSPASACMTRRLANSESQWDPDSGCEPDPVSG